MEIVLDLDELRYYSGVSQQKLARKLNITQTGVVRSEREQGVFRTTLLHYFGVLGGEL